MPAWALLLALAAEPAWKQVHTDDGIVVEARPVEGSPYAELRATTTVAVPAEALCAGAFGTGTRDPREPSLKSRKVLAESANERIAYDQIATPVISDRDYAVRTAREKTATGCRVTVDVAPGHAPPKADGLVRIEKLRCVWDFTPQADGKTKLTYVAWTDPNTSLPAFLVEPSRQKMMVTWTQLVIARGREAMAPASASGPPSRGGSIPGPTPTDRPPSP